MIETLLGLRPRRLTRQLAPRAQPGCPLSSHPTISVARGGQVQQSLRHLYTMSISQGARNASRLRNCSQLVRRLAAIGPKRLLRPNDGVAQDPLRRAIRRLDLASSTAPESPNRGHFIAPSARPMRPRVTGLMIESQYRTLLSDLIRLTQSTGPFVTTIGQPLSIRRAPNGTTRPRPSTRTSPGRRGSIQTDPLPNFLLSLFHLLSSLIREGSQ